MVSVSVSSHDDVQNTCKVALSLPFLYDVNVFACDIYLDLCWSHAPEYPPKCSVSIIRTIDVSEIYEPKFDLETIIWKVGTISLETGP